MVHIPHVPGKGSRRKHIKELIMFAPVWVGLWVCLFSFLIDYYFLLVQVMLLK